MRILSSRMYYQTINTIEMVICNFCSSKIQKIIYFICVLVCIGACTVMKTESRPPKKSILFNKIFVYDTKLRRIILRFNKKGCTVEQYVKIPVYTIKLEGTYQWILLSDTLGSIMGKVIIDLKNKIPLETPTAPKSWVRGLSREDGISDFGLEPCLEVLYFIKHPNHSKMSLWCLQNYDLKKVKHNIANQLYYYIHVEEKELEKDKIDMVIK